MQELRRFSLLYLASPYTRVPEGPGAAFRSAAKIAGRLMTVGVKVYSPICHGHPISVYGGVPMFDHSIWMEFDAAIMAKSDAICVAMMPSWEISYGVKHEIEVFTKAGKPVFYLDPETMRVESVSQEFWTGREGE